MTREIVERAAEGAEIAGVLPIVCGLLLASARVAVLAMIVAIRTFLSWSLALELEGRWPWQRAAQSPA